jgi:hypothetical protein
MQDLTAKRTLVKSPPELWEELSEVERLAKHLGAFGEITITKLEPEHTVAWEGEHASGTVSIEQSGWGTKVILTAELEADGDPPSAAAPPPDEHLEAGEPVDTADLPDRNGEDTEPSGAQPERSYADIPPAAALALDAAGAPAVGTGSGARADAPTERPRRRRGFWARLFAGWLAPERRLNRAAVNSPEEAGVAVERSDEVDGESTEDRPAASDGADVEEAEPASAAGENTGADAEPDTDEPQEDAAERPSAIDRDGARAVLEATLDALGSAHHRPYSRS